MFPAARQGDPITHDMLVPCGSIIGGNPDVLIEFMPAACMYILAVDCTGVITGGIVHPYFPGPPLPIVKGSMTVLIHGMGAARWMPSVDIAQCGAFLGLPSLTPIRTVLIGG